MEHGFDINDNISAQPLAMSAYPNKKKFLIVEDDFTLQPFWEFVIQKVDSNALIRWATSEEGAEKLIEDRKKLHDDFDVVISDVMLAGAKNGIDLWKRFGGKKTLFLFASGLPDRKINEMMGDLKRPMLLHKPLNPLQCIDSLRAMISFHNIFPRKASA